MRASKRARRPNTHMQHAHRRTRARTHTRKRARKYVPVHTINAQLQSYHWNGQGINPYNHYRPVDKLATTQTIIICSGQLDSATI